MQKLNFYPKARKKLNPSLETQHFLFLVPPNITFDDFVNPPKNISTISKNNGQKLFGSLITDIPLGIISLSAYIKKHSHVDVKAIDFNVELNKVAAFDYASFKEYFEDSLKAYQTNQSATPNYVGISALFTPAYHSIIELAELAKKYFPTALILVGGNFPTAMYKDILEDSPFVDAVCYGEGEKGLLGLLQAEDKQDFLKNSISWATHEKLTSPLLNLQHDFIEDLDEIPFLDYDILDLEGYKLNPTSSRYAVSEKYNAKIKDHQVDGELAIGKIEKTPISYSMPIMTSRGCPFKCTFCASHAAHGRDMRYHSLERVLADTQTMIEKYGIDGVVVQDDHFMAGKDRPYKIVDGLGKQGLGMFFQNALAIYALDIEFLKLLKRSGVDALVLPIESGSERVLKELMKKPLRLDLIPKVVKNCRDAGIFTDCNIILGMPGETKQDIEDSRKFLKTIGADWFRVFVATPIPGSEMYDTCEANDYFKVSPLKANYKRAVVETEHSSPEYVQYMTYLMNIELNFVHNANLKLGNYAIALESFINVINVKPDHAIAHYYAGVCYKHLKQPKKAKAHFLLAYEYTLNTDFWDEYIEMFDIKIKAQYQKYHHTEVAMA